MNLRLICRSGVSANDGSGAESQLIEPLRFRSGMIPVMARESLVLRENHAVEIILIGETSQWERPIVMTSQSQHPFPMEPWIRASA